MASIKFPLDYASGNLASHGESEFGSTSGANLPMIGFQACKIDANSSIRDLMVRNTNEWAWLPVPTDGISTAYGQGWEEETANAAKAGLSALTSKFFGSDEPEAAAEGTNAGTLSFTSVGKAALNFGKESLKEKLAGKGVTTRMLEQAYVSYSGPKYRSHSFSFSLRPKSFEESAAIYQIVEFFKRHSSPELLGGTADLVRLYKVPNVFKIKFVPNSGLFLIKPSALTDISVKYGGEKYNVFEPMNMPVQTDITLSFKEMFILSRDAFQDANAFTAPRSH